ncbi:MAG: 3'(2'),5'-bisphosphate nucleotidase CysQ [Alphaproteobacteria bacterium]|nr:3'(2'),5'-bisphosphate nucleotidase CysQ [Alphaproteobacteria bacterium]
MDVAVPLGYKAGAAIMKIYNRGFDVEIKADGTPVTEADTSSDAEILGGLHDDVPGIPVVTEEQFAIGKVPAVGRRFVLVDSLDGTREFICRNDEFTVNIALIEDEKPVLGVVYAPALDLMFAGAQGCGAFVIEKGVRRSISCRSVPDEGLTVLISRSHADTPVLDKFLEGRKIAERKSVGSSLKLCMIAAGEADLYPRFGDTMEWDIAAGHAVLCAAGGAVLDLDNQPLRYGKKPGFKNPSFIARGLVP